MGGKYTIEELEERMGHLCKKVYQETVADAYGWPPLYMRIDLLLDKQGRVWLGERESWGADVNGNDTKEKMNPTYKELANKMISQSKAWIMKNRKDCRLVRTAAKLSKRKASERSAFKSSNKRRLASEASIFVPSKRRKSTA